MATVNSYADTYRKCVPCTGMMGVALGQVIQEGSNAVANRLGWDWMPV